MKIEISYSPHPAQREVHEDPTRFKVIAAGRRFGKTIMLVNEHIKQALSCSERPGSPVQRSWYVSTTYRQAEMIAWRTALKFLPPQIVKSKSVHKLMIELVNGHIMEFKGAEDYDNLRGVGLVWVGLDEYELMHEEVWTEVLRPMLVESKGGAMFIGTPAPDGSAHFHDIFRKGEDGRDPAYRSWLFFTSQNPHLDPLEISEARRNLPPDIYKREFEADFSVTAGLIYDNFRHPVNVIPNYEPTDDDFIVGSIDPGLNNPTGALLCAWDALGVGRIFREYYVRDRLASENAVDIAKMARQYKISYWTIDRSSQRRDMTSGTSVFSKYQEHLRPLMAAPNDPGTVWAGIDEVKKLFHVDPVLKTPRLLITAQCVNTLWELGRYIRYKHKWRVEKNEEEKPRKLDDHLMDCIRNMTYMRPWQRRSVQILRPPPVAAY